MAAPIAFDSWNAGRDVVSHLRGSKPKHDAVQRKIAYGKVVVANDRSYHEQHGHNFDSTENYNAGYNSGYLQGIIDNIEKEQPGRPKWYSSYDQGKVDRRGADIDAGVERVKEQQNHEGRLQDQKEEKKGGSRGHRSKRDSHPPYD